MPINNNFNIELFEEATEKCALYGVKFSKNEFSQNPEKYTSFISKYDNEVKSFVVKNNSRLLDLQKKYSQDDSLPKFMALGRARLELEQEFKQQLLAKLPALDETNSKKVQRTQKRQETVQTLKNTVVTYVENTRQGINEARQLASSKIEELQEKRAQEIAKREANRLKRKEENEAKQLEQEKIKEEERLKREEEIKLKNAEKAKLKKEKILKREENKNARKAKRLEREEKRKAIVQNIKSNIENYKKQLQKEKQARIAKRKEFIRRQANKLNDISFDGLKNGALKSLKYAMIGIPVAGFSYMTYLGFKNPGQLDDNRTVKEVTFTPKKATARNNERMFNLSLPSRKKHKDSIKTDTQIVDTLPTHKYKSISSNIPVLSNDQLLQLPNIDLFNYCFNMTNTRDGQNNKYGVTKRMYDDFMSHNVSVARMNRIYDYNNLSYDDYRIIAKTTIYDQYGIGFMQNRSIAAYMYHILQKQYSGKNYVGAVAKGIRDFYIDEGKVITSAEKLCLDRLINNPYIGMRDWRQLVALINKTSVNPVYESKLFSYMKDRVENSKFADAKSIAIDNSRFTFEPTIDAPAIGQSGRRDSFIPDISNFNYSKITNIYELQKDRDLEVFFSIYMQCSHQNYVDLKYGNNKKYFFSEANRALRSYGIQSPLHPTLYCAGMSMASLCQAATIFKEENPNSHINTALTEFINYCQNVHSCMSLKNDLSMINSSVHRSYNLESDVKNYMKSNDDAVLFVWAPRGYSKYHHQTLFPSAETNYKDAYTYCAFNNQHWGNENTFARYMRSRSQYGKSGYFADIRSSLDVLAERSLNRALNNAMLSFNDQVAIPRFSFKDNTLS